ncbi:BLUF domain-containing protein [Sphingomonas citri]|jgi:hypothetical protein|uniref:BLUF domain-containing protein n=1 Tax=Sphingomonas citri TaxID=2862499 RepID=A0ABS7BR15_9SPHN|nr:BLUF domain-containing protein [Sphingomonas citri]MBW6532053.1 BLUF domain-containing protein [Sphingomonas citri]
MLQLVYISTAVGQIATASILAESRANNTRDRITGLLFSDGRRFLQALEGEPAMVERAFARISADPRHRALVVLSRREVAQREFGDWAMAERVPGSDGEAFTRRVAALVANASPAVRATFDSFARLQRAA